MGIERTHELHAARQGRPRTPLLAFRRMVVESCEVGRKGVALGLSSAGRNLAIDSQLKKEA